jgi:hypothetical protein
LEEQKLEGPAKRTESFMKKVRAGWRRNHFCSMSGWRKTGYAGMILLLLTSTKECAPEWTKWLTQFAYEKEIYRIAKKICFS